MNTNSKIHLVEIPIGGHGGVVWNRLHSEREDICQAMIKDSQHMSRVDADGKSARDTAHWHQELLQARLRKIDDALDRLMSGSYGNCSKCGRGIDGSKLEFDPALAFCTDCWERAQNSAQPGNTSQGVTEIGDSSSQRVSSPIELSLETLHPFETILVRTLNSDYRILLLDPKTGRALVEGGQYLSEPMEGLISGSKCFGSVFKPGAIVVGSHLEMWVNENLFSTSLVQSIGIEHRDVAEPIETVAPAVH